ncbi:MAG: hypothetical protein E7632_12430, partial [Ruminococcaceae bacterium]|nr:hypothetical protein [Oscillospiraceae bacterium]
MYVEISTDLEKICIFVICEKSLTNLPTSCIMKAYPKLSRKGDTLMKFSTNFVAAGKEFTTWYNYVPAPAFRRSFTIGKVTTAELTICGLGLYELFVNGNRITRGLLSPYIANPDDILPYDTYNLLPYLNNGENVIGVLLGNGMLNSFGGQVWEFDTARFRSAPKLALTFEAALEDGSAVEFDAASGFKCAPSPIILDDI